MSKKTEEARALLEKIELPWPLPQAVEGANLIQQGLVAVLMRNLTAAQAKAGLERLVKSYEDWNELRVAQAQEIATHLKGPKRATLAAARDVKTYLQEVFQQSHGIDLEFLREDPQSAARFVAQLPFLSFAVGTWLLWLARGGDVPITPGLVRVLDRVGLVPRSPSIKRARAGIEPLIAPGDEQRFLMHFGHVAEHWCDPRKPICWECPLVSDCKQGRKVYKDWQAQQARLAAQRAREEERLARQAAQEAERQRREEERARKKAEKKAALEAKKRKREEERQRKRREREKAKAAREAARAKEKAAREKARKEAAAKREAERKREAQKKAALKKASQKKAARKKAAKKAPAAKKRATRSRKGSASTRPAGGKKTVKKKAAKKSTRARKPAPSGRSSAKKAATRGAAAKKKSTARKAAGRKKTVGRKKSAKSGAGRSSGTRRKKTAARTQSGTSRKASRRR